MNRHTYRIVLTLGVLAAAPMLAPAQTAGSLSYTYTSGSTITSVNPGTTIGFPATVVGTSTTYLFTINNGRSSDVALSSITFNGTGFSVTGVPTALPAIIKAGASLSFQVSYSPLSLNRSQGGIALNFADSSAAFALDGRAVSSLQSFIFSYIVNPGGNQTAAPANSTISFNPAANGSNSTVTFVIRNNLNATASSNSLVVSGVAVAGEAFTTSGLPLFPATLAPQSELRFTITFTPSAASAFSGGLSIALLDSSISFNLQGQGLSPSLRYEVLSDAGFSSVVPEGTIALPQVAVGSSQGTRTTFRITNTGTASGRLSGIAFTTATNSFGLVELPVLPANLNPGESVTFSIVFTPQAVGANAVRLRIDNSFFNLTGVGLGALLQIAIDTGVGSTVAPNNSTLSIPNTVVGDKRTLPVVVQNIGNQSRVVNALAIASAGFALAGAPNLPVNLEPGGAISFQVIFTPTNTGTTAGILLVEDQTITLRGVGSAPPPLPGVTIAVQDSLQAQQQPTVGLTLANPYPFDLTGVLTLSFTGDSFVDDPAIQFATGGRTVPFRIRANTTGAVFGAQSSPQALFQVGTISGKVLFTASFAVASVDLTAVGGGPTKTSVVAAAPPVISSIKTGVRTAASIEVLVSGYSNTRELSQLVFSFTGTARSNVTTGTLPVNVQSAFAGWYQGSASQVYGSQFTVSVTFNITGDLTTIQTIAVNATNSKGTSTSQSVNLN